MARHLMRYISAALLAAVALAGAVRAETLLDPTRPPDALLLQSAPVAGNAQPSAQAGLSAVVTAREGVLALFNGETLRVGSHMNDGTVVRITSDAVFVKDAKGRTERLPLYPEVKITQVSPQTGIAKRSSAGQEAAAGGRRIPAPSRGSTQLESPLKQGSER